MLSMQLVASYSWIFN